MSARQQPENLEEPYQLIQTHINEIQEKLRGVIQQIDSIDGDDRLTTETIDQIRESRNATVNSLLPALEKLTTLPRGWSRHYYQETQAFINALNESVGLLLASNHSIEERSEPYLIDYAYIMAMCVDSLEKLYQQSALMSEQPLCSVKSLIVHCFVEFLINKSEPDSDLFEIFDGFLESYAPCYIPSNMKMPGALEGKNIFLRILDWYNQVSDDASADLSKRDKIEKIFSKVYQHLLIGRNLIEDESLDEKSFPKFNEAYTQKDTVFSEDYYSVIATAIEHKNIKILECLFNPKISKDKNEAKLKLSKERLIKILATKFKSYQLLSKEKTPNMEEGYLNFMIGLIFGRKGRNWKKDFRKKLREEFGKNKDTDAPGAISITSPRPPQIDLELKDEAEQKSIADIQSKLTGVIHGYGKLGLNEKLDARLDRLKKFEQNDDGRFTSDSAVCYVREFQNILTTFASTVVSVTANTSNPYDDINEDGMDMASLRTCAQVITLCQVVNHWHEQSQSIVSQATAENDELSVAKQRQCKRFLYLLYVLALQIRSFIHEQWGDFVQYNLERQCYTLNTTDQTIQSLGNQALQAVDSKAYLSPPTVSSIDIHCRGLLDAAQHIRLSTRFKKRNDAHKNQLFGKLCKAVFIDKKIATVPISDILETTDTSEFNLHAQVTLCFLITSPGAVSLPINIQLPQKIRIESVVEGDDSTTPSVELPTLVVLDELTNDDEKPDERSPSLATTTIDVLQPHISVSFAPQRISGCHPLLADALADNKDTSLPIYLSGTFGGLLVPQLLGLWPDADERILRYLKNPGADVDFLTTKCPSNWPTLTKLPLAGNHGQQYHWQLWTSKEKIHHLSPNDTTIQVGLDVVQLSYESEESSGDEESSDDIVQAYKTTGHSCISILDSFVLRVYSTGHYELISGDQTALKTQLQSHQLALAYLEQFNINVQQFKEKELSQADIDANASKLLKFFNSVVGLSSMSGWRETFHIEPQTLAFIQQNRNILSRLIKTMDYRRKRSFLAKIFNKTPDYVRAYLDLLLTLKLLNGFFHLNIDTLPKNEKLKVLKEETTKFNEHTNLLVQLLTVGVKALDVNIRAFLTLKQYFSSPPDQSSAFNLLIATVGYYKMGLYQTKTKLAEELRGLPKQFSSSKERALGSLLIDPQSLPPPTNQASIVQIWSQSYTPLELKHDEHNPVSSISIAIEQQSVILQREINAEIAKNITNYSHIDKMPKAWLAIILQKNFSVYLVNSRDDVVQKLAVFYMEAAGKRYTFTGVFERQVETELSETEILVFATRSTLLKLSSLKLAQDNIKFTYVIIGPYLGVLREWSACEELKKNSAQVPPILRPLLTPALPTAATVNTHELKLTDSDPILMTLNLEQYQAMQKVLTAPAIQEVIATQKILARQARQRVLATQKILARPARQQVVDTQETQQRLAVVDEPSVKSAPGITVVNGPPGTGKTQFICAMAQALVDEGLLVVIATQANQAAKVIAKRLMKQTNVTIACKIRQELEEAKRQIKWSLPQLKNWIPETLATLVTEKNTSTAINTLYGLSSQVSRTMPVFATQVNAILMRLISEITTQGSIDETMISPLISQIINLFPKGNTQFQGSVMATVDVIVGTLHGLAAHDMTRIVLQWSSSVANDNKMVLIIDEATQVRSQAILPGCFLDPVHLVVVGDPRQLGVLSYSKPAPHSVMKQCSDNNPNAQIDFIQSRRAGKAITQVWSDLAYQGKVFSVLPKEIQQRHHELWSHQSSHIRYLSEHPITLIDTQGQQRKQGKDYSHPEEARLAVKLALDLLKTMLAANPSWLKPSDTGVAIIAMYRGQLEEINKRLQEEMDKYPELREYLKYIEIMTTDGAQGSEAAYTIICTTRTLSSTNSKNPLGHLVDPRRLNVALSRAKVGLIILAQLKLFIEVTEAITVRVVDDVKDVKDITEEGVFILRAANETSAKTQAVTCLARGYDGKSVWCRLHQSADQAVVQASVLTHRDGSPRKTWSLPEEVKLAEIQSEQDGALDLLKYILLNYLTIADGESYMFSSINWRILLNQLGAHKPESSMIVSQQTVMGR